MLKMNKFHYLELFHIKFVHVNCMGNGFGGKGFTL